MFDVDQDIAKEKKAVELYLRRIGDLKLLM